ncbi:MAG: energy-coupling factor transporter transmembrane protein EcfT [Propionibacteriaceae bacterium]|jgi:energy-coupling factor transport system permease protein|nr:energy-coupling factor transporter transmembrane protein EcfT [Propionibacteriaceae bacterium]
MALGDALSYRNAPLVALDPRTSGLVLILVNVICLTAGFDFGAMCARIIVTALVTALLAAEKRWHWVMIVAVGTGLSLVIEAFGFQLISGPVSLLIAMCANLAARFLPIVGLGTYVLTTTTISAFMAALRRIRVPMLITIPFAVVLRMIPTVANESSAIAESMRSRGLRLGSAPARDLLEYRLVPLIFRTVDLGDELAAAALIRGLSVDQERTSTSRLGFHVSDFVVLLIAVAATVLWVVL